MTDVCYCNNTSESVDLLAYFPTKKYDSDDKSGANVHVTELIEKLSDQCASLTVVGAGSSNTTMDGVTVITARKVTIPVFDKIVPLIHGTIQSTHHLLSSQGNVIYSRSDMSSIFALLLSTVFRIPSVVEVNGISESEIKHHNSDSVEQRLKSMSDVLADRNLHRHDRLVAVTPEIETALVNRYGIDSEKIVVIPNGANTDLFRPLNESTCREELGLDHDSIYVTFVGSFLPWQGLEHVLQAVPKVTEERPDVQFLLVGDGPCRSRLEQLVDEYDIEDNVRFTGNVDYDSVPTYINASDLCVVYKNPIDFGYSPLKLYEYLACGTPVVASDIEGLRIVEQLDCGQIVEPEQPDEFADTVLGVLNNADITREARTSGREYVLENHSWEVVAESVHSVCKTAIGDSE